MERKIMHKSKGRWIVLSSSLLLSAVALGMATSVEVQAQELTDDATMVADDAATLTEDETAQVEAAVAELMSEVVAADEELAEPVTEAETEEVPEVEAAPEVAIQEAPVTMAKARVASGTHTVAYGDTLWKIASSNGITVAQLRQWNNLSSDAIFVGDQLVVSNPGTTTPAPTTPTTPTTPETPAPTQPSTATYTVRPGDYLYKIATANNVTVAQLKAWNNLTSNYIYSGDKLVVSNPATSTPTPTPTPEPETPTTPPKEETPTTTTKTYTVRPGDYLYKIATANNITVAQLKAWNNLTSNYIYSGDKLIVSKTTTTTPTPKPEKPTTPPKEETPKEETPTTAKTYTVKSGDSLWLIANNNGVSIAQLKAWNNLSSNYIYSGDVFYVSDPSKVTTPTPKPEEPKEETPKEETPKEETPTTAKTYTVKSGDSLWLIANNNGVTIAQLKAWNNLTSNYIYSGDVFYVTDPSKVTTPTPTPTPTDPETPTPPVVDDGDKTEESFDVKINQKNQDFYVGSSLSSATKADSIKYFGQRFQVVNETKDSKGKKLYEVAQNGVTVGFVSADAAVEVPANQRVVYLDAGHGGSETGTHNFGVAEKDLNLKITRQLAERLRSLGYMVYESRTSDIEINIRERDDEPNELMPDIYVSVHHNAMPASYGGSVNGIVTLYHHPNIDEPGYKTLDTDNWTRINASKKLSESIQSALIKATGANDQGARQQNLHVTRTSNVPATLVELGFMDNWAEHQKLITPSYQQKLIGGLVTGITSYFGH